MENDGKFDEYKKIFAKLPAVTSATSAQALYAVTKAGGWNRVTPLDFETGSGGETLSKAPTACAIAIGILFYDAICLILNCEGLRAAAADGAFKKMGEAFTSTELSTLETYIKTLSEEDRSDATKARILFDLMVKVKDASGFETVIEAFLSGLTWEDGLIFGLTSTVTIASLFGPGALEFPLEIVEAIGDAYFIGEDINNAIKICKPAGDEVTASPGAFSEPTISIKTFSGNYLTFVDNGDMGGDAQVLHTNSKTADFWQKFTTVPVDVAKLTFAIRTPSGYYLSAVNGGGLGEGSQPFFPPKHPPPALHTNATTASTWEKFILKYNTDGTYSLRSTSGWYLTFLQGGGVGGDNDWWCPLHTDARVIGDWETFSFTLPG